MGDKIGGITVIQHKAIWGDRLTKALEVEILYDPDDAFIILYAMGVVMNDGADCCSGIQTESTDGGLVQNDAGGVGGKVFGECPSGQQLYTQGFQVPVPYP